MIGDAISYPTQHDDWLKTILIGGALHLLSFLIIPIFILGGFQVRVLRSAALGEETLPTFGDWGDLLVDGFKLFLIGIVYMFIPYLILFASFFAESSIMMLVSSLLLLILVVFLPVAQTNFALNDSFGAAFDISTVAGAAFTSDYLIALVVALVIGTVLGLIGGLLSIILVGLLVVFYSTIVTNYIIARGCGPALRQQTAEEFAT